MKKIIKKFEVENIKALTNYIIDQLEVGDVVAKNTNGQYHNYIVTFKKDLEGICLTYTDATYLETISYDYVEGNWVYNSQDSTVVASKSYVDSLMSGALKRLIVEALPETDIDTNTIYMVLDSEASQQGNVYNEYLYINNAWELIGTTEVAETVVANPTLAGTEADLTALQVGETKYKVASGGGIEFVEINDTSGNITQAQATSLTNGAYVKYQGAVLLPMGNYSYYHLLIDKGAINMRIITFDISNLTFDYTLYSLKEI